MSGSFVEEPPAAAIDDEAASVTVLGKEKQENGNLTILQLPRSGAAIVDGTNSAKPKTSKDEASLVE